jgi:SAM-dependent methyltransferase
MLYPFHFQVQEYFPDFDYKKPKGDRAVLCDFRNPGNMVGHQQRAFSVYWALKKCSPTDLGLDIGSPKGLTPYCIHVDLFGDGQVHPYYGGGPYFSDVVGDAGKEMPFPKGGFPYITSNHSLEHMGPAGDDAAIAVLERWVGLLRPDGILAAILPDNDLWDTMAGDKDHKHAWGHSDFSARILGRVMDSTKCDLIAYNELDNNFSFDFVIQKR